MLSEAVALEETMKCQHAVKKKFFMFFCNIVNVAIDLELNGT